MILGWRAQGIGDEHGDMDSFRVRLKTLLGMYTRLGGPSATITTTPSPPLLRRCYQHSRNTSPHSLLGRAPPQLNQRDNIIYIKTT